VRRRIGLAGQFAAVEPDRARPRDRPVGRVHLGLPAHVLVLGVRPDGIGRAPCAPSRTSIP
jgi:hypothetical protein